jgi:hypothetical protein
MYRIFFFLLSFLAFGCSKSSDCLNCSVTTTSDESVRCGISNQFDQIDLMELGEVCTQAELDSLILVHDLIEFPLYSSQCGGEPYTRTTRVVCN